MHLFICSPLVCAIICKRNDTIYDTNRAHIMSLYAEVQVQSRTQDLSTAKDKKFNILKEELSFSMTIEFFSLL